MVKALYKLMLIQGPGLCRQQRKLIPSIAAQNSGAARRRWWLYTVQRGVHVSETVTRVRVVLCKVDVVAPCSSSESLSLFVVFQELHIWKLNSVITIVERNSLRRPSSTHVGVFAVVGPGTSRLRADCAAVAAWTNQHNRCVATLCCSSRWQRHWVFNPNQLLPPLTQCRSGGYGVLWYHHPGKIQCNFETKKENIHAMAAQPIVQSVWQEWLTV